jgi:hypothetical protein
MSVKTTVAPSRAKASAHAAPMPRAAPVINATLLESLAMPTSRKRERLILF